MKEIITTPGGHEYKITIGSGLISRAEKFIPSGGKNFILTDDGVPGYADTLAARVGGNVFTVPAGESSKSAEMFLRVISAMSSAGLGRRGRLIAVGGGVVGDLGGFCASVYMRGIDFYNFPTTLLSQVDSSVGGKNGLDINGIKNQIGTFYQPRGVVIDTDTLRTLSPRQVASGVCEALKMAMTSDRDLFELIERDGFTEQNAEEIICRAVDIKRRVVEADEREGGLRRILNFGHTIGHAIESSAGLGTLTHGECVALGILPMIPEGLRERVIPVYEKLGLPTDYTCDCGALVKYMEHDKKAEGETLLAVLVDKIGECHTERMTPKELAERAGALYGEKK